MLIRSDWLDRQLWSGLDLDFDLHHALHSENRIVNAFPKSWYPTAALHVFRTQKSLIWNTATAEVFRLVSLFATIYKERKWIRSFKLCMTQNHTATWDPTWSSLISLPAVWFSLLSYWQSRNFKHAAILLQLLPNFAEIGPNYLKNYKGNTYNEQLQAVFLACVPYLSRDD
jgi:hypothetical protein